MTRIAVGGIRYEANSFASFNELDLSSLRRGGDVVLDACPNSEVAGAVSRASSFLGEVELVGLVDVFAGCGGPPNHAEYERLVDELVEHLLAAGPLDGVYLALHGAMATDQEDDAEALLLERVRSYLPGNMPIVVSFDLHAAVSERTASLVDGIVGFKTCPHIDYEEVGARALEIAVEAARGEIHPEVLHFAVPILTPAESSDTTDGLVASFMREALEFPRTHQGVLDVSLFAVQPWLDTHRTSWSVTATVDLLVEGIEDAASAVLVDLRERILDAASERMPVKVPVDQVWEAVDRFPEGLVVAADTGDSPSAGAGGDSTHLLSELMAAERPSVLATIADEEAALLLSSLWRQAGEPREVNFEVGGSSVLTGLGPLKIAGELLEVCDGRYLRRYPPAEVDVGACAIVRTKNVTLVVTQRAAFMVDQDLFKHLDIDPTGFRVAQVKSAGGYRAYWDPDSVGSVLVDSRGASSSQLRSLPFRHLRDGLTVLEPSHAW